MLHSSRIILGIAAAVSRRTTVHAFSYKNCARVAVLPIRRCQQTNSLYSASSKEICETTIDKGKAEVLCTVADEDNRSSLWSDVAINAAKQFTISQRQKLKDLGALDIERQIKIVGEPFDNCGLGDCVIDYDNLDNESSATTSSADTKIIHFQRHGQGYHNLICDMWRELERPIDFDSPDPNLNPVVRPEFLDPH